MTTKDLENNTLFKFGPPPIQTAEDAREAYLRGLITEDELKDAIGRFGHAGGANLWHSPTNLERPDAAFERDLPDEFFEQPGTAILEGKDRLKVVEDKAKVREAAEKAAEKVTANVKPEVDVAEAKNEASEKAAEKPQAQLDKDVGKLSEKQAGVTK